MIGRPRAAALAVLCGLTAGCPRPSERPAPAEPATSTGPAAPAAPAPPAAPPRPQPDLAFTDVTAAAGVHFRHMTGASGERYFVEPHSGGCAVLDADGDGRPDLYAVDGGPLPGYAGARQRGNRLFRNLGDGRFEDVTERAGVAGTGYGFGAYPADLDGDGDEDLLVTQLGPDALYLNQGDGTFREAGAAAGIAGDAWSSSAAWLDADADGDLDLFVAHYVEYDLARNRVCIDHGVRHNCGPWAYTPAADALYRNRGDGTFEDATAAAGLSSAHLHGLGVLAYDFDVDGRADLYVANDKTPNLLFRSSGGGRFEETGLLAGVSVGAAGLGQAGMGVDAGDLDDDGLPDLVVTNFQEEWNNDFRQVAPGVFEDRAESSGFGPPSGPRLGFGVLLLDLDLDADLDAFVANGHVWSNVNDLYPHVRYPQTNLLLRNAGGRFTDVSARSGEPLRREEVSRGTCGLDIEGDGDLDMFYVNLDGPAVLLRNDTDRAGAHWLRLHLVGAAPNTGALGARVEARAGGRTQRRQVWAARGFLSSSERTVHLGLGDATRAESVRVVWPDGRASDVGPLDADRTWEITQATGRATARRP